MTEPAFDLSRPMGKTYRKGADESTSLLGQLLHNWEPRVFDVFDMDCVVWKSERKCLRYFEEKLGSEQVSAAQRRNLWVLALGFEFLKVAGVIRDGGVWLVRIGPDRADEMDRTSPLKVQQVTADSFGTKDEVPMIGTWETFRPLFTGEEWSR